MFMANYPTADLARFCARLQYADLSATVRERVRYLLLDHLAVTIRGSALPSSLAGYQMLEQMAIGNINTATIFGRQERAEAAWASLANGIAAHGLEMDDVENRSSLHPGVIVFPAALALAEQIGSQPADFYSAVIAGYEVTLRVGAALNPASSYERGFHPTAVCGTLGAAAASSRLVRLAPGQTNMALGIAGSMAAGFVGPTSILESSYGFLQAYSSASDISQLVRKEEDEFAIMQVSIKPYACCRYMHGPIDCLFEIIHTYHPNPEHIELVRCGVLTGGRGLIADPIDLKRQPKNVVEAQFSMPFGAAIALLTGTAGMSVFTNERIHDSKVQELMQRVECYSSTELDEYYPEEWRASASVRMADGREFSANVRHALGDPHNPLSWEQLEARFHELVAPVIVEDRKRKEIIERVKGLDTLEKITW